MESVELASPYFHLATFVHVYDFWRERVAMQFRDLRHVTRDIQENRVHSSPPTIWVQLLSHGTSCPFSKGKESYIFGRQRCADNFNRDRGEDKKLQEQIANIFARGSSQAFIGKELYCLAYPAYL